MRKLTKIINKRRKNYKATVGLVNEYGKRCSVNGVLFYMMLRAEEKDRAEREARKFMMKFVQEACPNLVTFMNILGSMTNWSSYYY